MASQQPPAGRPWFRLASMARMEAAVAAAAAPNPPRPTTPPVPRLPVPMIQQQLPPPIPPPQVQPPPPPSQLRPPTPPPQQPEPRPELQVTPALQPEIQTRPSAPPPPPSEPLQPPLPPRIKTPPESPKVIRPSYSTPPASPIARQRQTAQAPPMELTPNPEPEPEPKPLLPLQPKTITVPEVGKGTLNSVFYNKTQGSTTEQSNGTASAGKIREEGVVKAITIAGENTGAIMELGSAAHRRRAHHHRGTNVQQEGNGYGHMVEHELGDGKSEEKHNEKGKGGMSAAKAKPMAAVVNSNVQSINNSIVLNSSCTQQSPGVHITFASHHQPKSRAGTSSHKAHIPHIN